MESSDLKNYGKSILEMFGSVPVEILDETALLGFEIIQTHLGDARKNKFVEILPSFQKDIQERLRNNEHSKLFERGLQNDEFIEQQSAWAASYIAVEDVTDAQTAQRIFYEISGTSYPKFFSNVFPDPISFQNATDSLELFFDWFSEMMKCCEMDGSLSSEITKKKADYFQINCTWCAWHEIFKCLDVERACLPVCHADDVFFPDYCRQFGVRYNRTQTLATGGDCCNYRFERI